MWKRLSNPTTALILSKNHSTQTKCLVCDSLFVLMETWKIVMFSFQAFLPDTSALLVQSRPLQCVCILLRQKRTMHGERTALRQCVSAKGPMKKRWYLKAMILFLSRLIHLEQWTSKTVKLTAGPGGPFCPGGPGAPMGTSPYRGQTAAHVLFTELAKVDICSRTTLLQTSITCSAGRVGPCVTNHYHIHHWKGPNCGTCNKEYYRTGHAEAMAASQRKCNEEMKPKIFP